MALAEETHIEYDESLPKVDVSSDGYSLTQQFTFHKYSIEKEFGSKLLGPEVGQQISNFIDNYIKLAKIIGKYLLINGDRVIAEIDPEDTQELIIAKMDKMHEIMCRAVEIKKQREITNFALLVVERDRLIVQFRTLNWENSQEIIDWIYDFSAAMNKIALSEGRYLTRDYEEGKIIQEVLDGFAAHGFKYDSFSEQDYSGGGPILTWDKALRRAAAYFVRELGERKTDPSVDMNLSSYHAGITL